MNENYGNYIGKQIGDYKILGKNRVNNRIKYLIKCDICCCEKWTFNAKDYKHGRFCEGRRFKVGSKKIGEMYGDYIVIDKIVKNNRSCYIVKCTICNSIKEVYNLREERHNESCSNFKEYILGKTYGDFIITNCYKENRQYVDVKCLVCGCKREHVCCKDLKLSFTNKHSAMCTIKNTEKYSNKKLVNKLLRTYQNMNTRIRKEPAYKNIKNLFKDSVDFVTYVYDMYEERLEEGIPLRLLSIDRINPYGNYEKGNVRCLTTTEQQYNKKTHWKESVETIESSVGDEQVE